MTIPAWNYLEEYQLERDEILEAIDKVFRSGRLILGKSVADFETEFSAYCQTTYGIGVASGTDALFLALKALEIGPGDEVITVANTAVPTVSAIISTGATPRFVDINLTDLLIDTEAIEKSINRYTRCILPVHLYGQCADMDEIRRIADQYGLFVIEDCAQAHGALYKNRKAGSMSDVGAFSFYPTKILGTYGDGGIVVTEHSEIAARLRRLRFYGMDENCYAEEHGYNSRLDELHAAILRVKLRKLDSYIEKRRTLAQRYHKALAETSLILPKASPNSHHAYCLYVCRHSERDLVTSQLAEQFDINLNVNYRWPIHLMKGYECLGYKNGDLPHAEKACREVFSLPMYPTLGLEQQDTVIHALQQVC